MNADDNDTPELAEIIEAAAERIARKSLGGWMPGRIESFNAATCRATVTPLLLEDETDELGEHYGRRRPVLDDVPVLFLAGGGVRIRVPLKRGDTVILLAGARSVDKWKNTGGEVTPEDERHHTLDDSVAIPVEIVGAANAAAFIEFTTDGLIKAGGNNPLVTRDEFLKHTHATAATGTPSPPIPHVTGGSAVSFPGTSKLRG